MTKRPLYQVLASLLVARDNCVHSGNVEWERRHAASLDALVADHLPRGSGFDNGTHLDITNPGDGRKLLRFETSYHKMDENGMYDGWADYTVAVRPDLLFGIQVIVHGTDNDGLKEYVAEQFLDALMTPVEQYPKREDEAQQAALRG